jgi:hypothetical protein
MNPRGSIMERRSVGAANLLADGFSMGQAMYRL